MARLRTLPASCFDPSDTLTPLLLGFSPEGTVDLVLRWKLAGSSCLVVLISKWEVEEL
jgi:hypothetical protein